MRILYDGTTLRPGQTGVGYYTEHLLHHMARQLGDDDEIFAASNRPMHTSLPLPDPVRVLPSRQIPIRLAWMQTALPAAARRIRPDVAHFTNSVVPLVKIAPTVVTIHDMTLNLLPRMHPLKKQILTRPFVALAARRADAVITVSESARRDILRLTGLPEEKVCVIHEAAAGVFGKIRQQASLEEARRRYGLSDRLILYVGTIEPRKNVPLVIDAFARLRQSAGLPHQLVCVGPKGWGFSDVRRRIEEHELDGSVVLTGYVPIEDLACLYNLSEIFVFPSLYEGFGLPVMEAMSCGVPVITSQNSALKEIAGSAVETVDPESEDSLAGALARLATDPRRRAELSAAGRARAAQFSWDLTAQRTLEVYRRVARSEG